MTKCFEIVVLDERGEVLSSTASANVSSTHLGKALSLAYDIYRIVDVVAKELRLSAPRSISIKTDEYEALISKRADKIVVAVIFDKPSLCSV